MINPKDEAIKIKEMLNDAGISETRQKMLNPIIENVTWMEMKLEVAREQIRDSAVAIAYDNGGGQTGIRENPLYKGYEALWKSYMSGMEKILESLPKEVIEQETQKIEKPATVLELVRNKHKA